MTPIVILQQTKDVSVDVLRAPRHSISVININVPEVWHDHDWPLCNLCNHTQIWVCEILCKSEAEPLEEAQKWGCVLQSVNEITAQGTHETERFCDLIGSQIA